MLCPLPVRDPGSLVEVLSLYPDLREPPQNGYAWKYFEWFRDQNRVFSDVTGASPSRYRHGGGGVKRAPSTVNTSRDLCRQNVISH